jgi:hypothetical protein
MVRRHLKYLEGKEQQTIQQQGSSLGKYYRIDEMSFLELVEIQGK